MALYLPMVFVVWLLATFAQSSLLYGLVWSLLGAYVVSQVWARRGAASLEIERHFIDRAYTGEEIQLETRISNRGLLPIPWVEINDTVPMELHSEPLPPQVTSLGSHREERLHYRLECKHRGYYTIGPMRMRTGDLLGLDQRSVTDQEQSHLIVYPRVVPLRRLGLPTYSALVALPSRHPLFEDPARVVGIREYVPTDSLRRIHWTATARTGHLMVKQFQPAIARTTMLCLDLCLRDYEPKDRNRAMELAIVVAASLATHAVTRERLSVGLSMEAYDPLKGEIRRMRLPPGSDSLHLMTILEVLARVQSVAGDRFARVLRDEGAGLSWGSTIVAICGSENTSLNDTLLHLKRSGHAVALILIRSGVPKRAVSTIPTYRVWSDGDLLAI
jgi:uncharacterized protein (DUF58 family)